LEDAMVIAIQIKEIRQICWVRTPGESGFDDIRKCAEFIDLILNIR
jgi:hypothetical protein